MTTDDMVKVVKTSKKLIVSMLRHRPKYYAVEQKEDTFQLSVLYGQLGDHIMEPIEENWKRSERYHCHHVSKAGEVPRFKVTYLTNDNHCKSHVVAMRLNAPENYFDDVQVYICPSCGEQDDETPKILWDYCCCCGRWIHCSHKSPDLHISRRRYTDLEEEVTICSDCFHAPMSYCCSCMIPTFKGYPCEHELCVFRTHSRKSCKLTLCALHPQWRRNAKISYKFQTDFSAMYTSEQDAGFNSLQNFNDVEIDEPLSDDKVKAGVSNVGSHVQKKLAHEFSAAALSKIKSTLQFRAQHIVDIAVGLDKNRHAAQNLFKLQGNIIKTLLELHQSMTTDRNSIDGAMIDTLSVTMKFFEKQRKHRLSRMIRKMKVQKKNKTKRRTRSARLKKSIQLAEPMQEEKVEQKKKKRRVAEAEKGKEGEKQKRRKMTEKKEKHEKMTDVEVILNAGTIARSKKHSRKKPPYSPGRRTRKPKRGERQFRTLYNN